MESNVKLMGVPVFRTRSSEIAAIRLDPSLSPTSTTVSLPKRSVRAVKEEARRIGLRSRKRIAPNGRKSGGGYFDRGQIHHILTNPIYAGRIRHKTDVYHGQHPAIIDPDVWDAIQCRLNDKAARARSGRGGIDRRHAVTSPLVGKIFDEVGDRLTPSHSRTSAGKRLRYYVSKRLIQKSGEKQPAGGWRLPAHELEEIIANAVRDRLADPKRWSSIAGRCLNAAANTVTSTSIIEELDQRAVLDFVERVDLAKGQLTIILESDRIKELVQIDHFELKQEDLTFALPFRQRRRGVETRLIIENPTSNRDQTLIRNVALAHSWFAELRNGASFTEVAERAGTSKRRVMQLVDLAFLAPDLTAQILDGQQPASLTSDVLIRQGIPSDWDEQRRLFDSLR